MNKTLKVTLFLLFGTMGVANAQSVESLTDSTHLVEQTTSQNYDSLWSEVSELKSHLNLMEHERMQERIWKRKKYLKLGMMFPTVKYVEGDGELSWNTDMAFMLQMGKTAYLHAKPIAGMVKIGLDWGLLCFNYEKLKPKNDYIFAEPDDYYGNSDDDEFVSLPDLGMHKIEWAPHIGPSVSVNPWKHLITSAYFHVMPTASLILANDELSSGFGCVMAAGVSVAYKSFSLGFEWAWSTIKYTQSSFDDEEDCFDYDDGWGSDMSSVGFDNVFSTEKFKLKTSCPRIYLSIRW